MQKKYSFTQIKSICKEQGYKLACLENAEGERIVPNNAIKINVHKHIAFIQSRLKNEIFQDGVYYVCLSHNINSSRNPDRYPIVKGKLNDNTSVQRQPEVIVQTHAESVLSWDQALAMQKEISDLKSELAKFKYENNELAKKVEELESELDELEDEEGLKEPVQKTGLEQGIEFLKESAPMFDSVLTKYFDLKERELSLKEKGHISNSNTHDEKKTKTEHRRVKIDPGSENHIAQIRHYHSQNNEDRLNEELDKLEEANPELYKQLCEELGLES